MKHLSFLEILQHSCRGTRMWASKDLGADIFRNRKAHAPIFYSCVDVVPAKLLRRQCDGNDEDNRDNNNKDDTDDNTSTAMR